MKARLSGGIVLTASRTIRSLSLALSLLGATAASVAQTSSTYVLAAHTSLRSASAPLPTLISVQALLNQKLYMEAAATFASLPEPAKASASGESLLCDIDAALPDRRDPAPCASAIHLELSGSTPGLWKSYAAVASRDLDLAEADARKFAQTSSSPAAKQMLALVDYLREKYTLVTKQLPQGTSDTFTLTLLEGAALRSGNTESFHALEQRIRSAKGPNNGWQLYRDGLAAQQELHWDAALDDFRRCDADPDFIDSICAVSVANVELKQGSRTTARQDIDAALVHYASDTSVLNETIYIDLVTRDAMAAKQTHATLALKAPQPADASECLYFYGIDQPSLASPHCLAAVNTNDKSNVAWSNAGYVALDLGQYQTAMADFAQAESLYEEAHAAHTVTQELDLYWGLLLAGYMAGNKDDAKALYVEIEKENPDFSSIEKLDQLPLVWSKTTLALMSKVTSDLIGPSAAFNASNPTPANPTE